MNEEEIKKEIKVALSINSETDLVGFKNASGGFPKKEVKKLFLLLETQKVE